MEYTVVIDDRLLEDAREAAGTTELQKVIELGLRELVRQQRLRALIGSLRNFELSMTEDELQGLRRTEVHRLELDE